MKQSIFTEEQILQILCEGDNGAKIAELCRQHGIARITFYKWKAKYGGMKLSDVKRLRALEVENMRLKKLVADQALDIVGLRDVLSKKW